MLSSYLGRWMSVAVLVLLAALAAAALFLDPDYPAHVPVRIGVTAFGKDCAGDALRSLAARVREDDGGDITWVWLEGDEISGCDFYLMTSPQFAAASDRGMECLLLASPRDDGKLPIGVVVTAGEAEPDWSRTAFTSAASAAGFISPLAALAAAGTDLSLVSFDILSGGCPLRGDGVAWGVAMGRYGAGGLPLEELRRLEKSGVIGPGRLRIALTGPELPEIVLASDPSTEQWKSAGFARRLPRIAGRIDGALKREMSGLGMASLRPPGEGEMDLLDGVPDEVWERAGYHFP
jgi:hypothetical protein